MTHSVSSNAAGMLSRTMESRKVTAYHEAGHAVVAYKLGIRLARKGVTIVSEEGSRGAVWHTGALGGRPDSQITDKMICNAERLVMVSLAGIESQQRYRKSSVRHYHAHSDYQSAVDLLFRFSGGGEEVSLWMKLLALRTRSIIESPIWWPVIVDFAELMLEKQNLSGKEAESAICSILKKTPAALGSRQGSI